VLDHSGHPVAAVAITFPTHSADPAALAVHVRRSAARVARRIRGREGGYAGTT
jgi:DNA-binding IclR family transcriptional regulator